MLKHNKQNKKMNNKGMSLVEIIVTVTVLALVSGFILSAFVSAMRTSAKSRDVHRATTVAQNIMEGINLKTAEEMAYQFNYPVIKNSSGADVDNFNIYPSSMFQYGTNYSVGELMEWTDPITGDVSTEVAGTYRSLSEYKALTNDYEIATTASAYMSDITSDTYDFLQDTDGKYIYYMRNIKNDGRYYNAKITLDATAYKNSGSTGLTVNDDEIISVPTIDSAYDAVEVMKDTLDQDGLSLMEMSFPSETVSESNLYRVIEVTIDNDLMVGTTGQYRTSVKVDYYYYIKKADNTVTLPISVIGTNTIFDNDGNETEKQLRNIYLYYYPMYSSSFSNCKDYITIKNNDNMDVEVYVIKQEPASGVLTQTEITAKEQLYGVTFNVEETTNNVDGKSHITLHTNWNSNLGSIYTGMELSPNQAIFRRNGIPTAKEMYRMTDIKNKKAYDRIYDVTVDIYTSEESEDFNTFYTGTALSEWFKEENHLITVTSSISQ